MIIAHVLSPAEGTFSVSGFLIPKQQLFPILPTPWYGWESHPCQILTLITWPARGLLQLSSFNFLQQCGPWSRGISRSLCPAPTFSPGRKSAGGDVSSWTRDISPILLRAGRGFCPRLWGWKQRVLRWTTCLLLINLRMRLHHVVYLGCVG